MKKIIYDIISNTVKTISKSNIVGKEFNGLNKKLYYERAQHLTFLFQKKIKYEENIQRKIMSYLKKGDTVFDIGANIGQYALPFSEIVGDSGKVYSFEPDSKIFSFLQFNANINKCTNITCCNFGIGKENTEKEFFRDTETGGRKGSFKKEFVGENFRGYKEKVAIKSFDEIISKFGEPNFVKIDVEGFEEDVITGLTMDLEDCIFLIEIREETKKRIFDYFNRKGYYCTWIDNEDPQVINIAEEIPEFANLIFKKSQ